MNPQNSQSKHWRRWILGLLLLLSLLWLLSYCAQKESSEEVPASRHTLPRPKPAQQSAPEQRPVEAALPRAQAVVDEASVSTLRARAKLNLSTIYSAQQSFFAEHGRYSTDLVFIGWSPSVVQLDFKLGFLQEFRPVKPAVSAGTEEDPSRMDTDEFLGTPQGDENERVHYSRLAEAIELADFERFCRAGCRASENGFEVLVVLPLDAAGRVDVWTITEKKKLTQVWDGVRGVSLR